MEEQVCIPASLGSCEVGAVKASLCPGPRGQGEGLLPLCGTVTEVHRWVLVGPDPTWTWGIHPGQEKTLVCQEVA